MVNRPLFVGLIGAVIVGAAIALTTYFEFQPGARPQGGAPASAPAHVARSGPPAPIPRAAVLEATSADNLAKLVTPEHSRQPVGLSFTTVRVNPVGDVVIAGRATDLIDTGPEPRARVVGLAWTTPTTFAVLQTVIAGEVLDVRTLRVDGSTTSTDSSQTA